MFDHVHGRRPTGAGHERPRQRIVVGDSPRRRASLPKVFESVSVIVSLPSSWVSSKHRHRNRLLPLAGGEDTAGEDKCLEVSARIRERQHRKHVVRQHRAIRSWLDAYAQHGLAQTSSIRA